MCRWDVPVAPACRDKIQFRLVLQLLIILCGVPVLSGAPFAGVGATVKLDGRDYVDTEDVAARLGMSHNLLSEGKNSQVKLYSERNELILHVDKRILSLNDVRVYLGFPILEHEGKLWVSLEDVEATLLPILDPSHSGEAPRLGRIILDAGHGGRDPGAISPEFDLVESHLTLDLAERLRRLLLNRGYEVLATRATDRYLSLEERATLANEVKGDLFISLHFNVAGSMGIAGIETFALTPPGMASSSRTSRETVEFESYPGDAQNKWSTLAGYHIQSGLVSATQGTDRGFKRARFQVLRQVASPSILIEAGFLSSAEEGPLIQSPAYRERLAKAIVDGITHYHLELNQLKSPQP